MSLDGGLAKRIAITIAVPLAYVLLGDQVPLPGLTLPPGMPTPANLTVFALGVAPIVSGYWFVEFTAWAMPWWRHLRHGNPEGRAKLDLASRALAIVLAAMQAFGMALSLRALGSEGDDVKVSVPLVVATLVGGVCLTFVLAQIVTRSGLLNGLVALLCAATLRETVTAIADAGDRAPNAVAATVVGLATLAFATWCALRGAGDVPSVAPGAPWTWLPIPSGSIQPNQFAVSLLLVPATLANFHVPMMQQLQSFLSTDAFLPAAIAVAGLATVAFAAVLHRPHALAALAKQLGASGSSAAWDPALRRTLLPSFLFVTVVLVAGNASHVATFMLTLVVAAAMDFTTAVRQEHAAPVRVVVWEDRRATAVPMLRALLAREGIENEARGAAVLTLLQVFAPYAPAQLLVDGKDAARAQAILRTVFAGDEEAARSRTAASPTRVRVEPWTLARRTSWLGATVALALIALSLSRASNGPAIALAPRAKIEVTRVDDTIDAFATVNEDAIPEGQGIAVYLENVPVGPGRTIQSHFARMILHDGEGLKSAAARIRPWLDTVRLPPDRRFAFQAVTELDDATEKWRVIGLRTLVLTGDPVLRTSDIVDAIARVDEKGLDQAYVLVTLSSSAAKRFEDATREWTGRRLAIVVDDEVTSAPVVKTAIGGGRISITMGAGDPEKQLAEAHDLEARLRGK